MPSKLKAVAPKAAEPSKPKIVIFGSEGKGKTWFSLHFPNVYFIDVEGGANRKHYTDILESSGGMYMGPSQGAQDFETVIEQVQALATERHPYKTVVIDSVTKLYNLAVSDEAERLRLAGKKNEFSVDKKAAEAFARRLIMWISRIDMNVILIAHQVDIWEVVNGVREAVRVGPDAWKKLAYELDLTIQVQTAGPRRFGKIGKSRLLGFPEGDTFDLSYDEFAARYGRDVIEKDALQIVLVTPDQLKEVGRLLEVVKVSTDWESKIFKKYNVEEWEEMEAHHVDNIIAALKERISP